MLRTRVPSYDSVRWRLDRNLMSSPFEFLNTSLFGALYHVFFGGDLI